MKSEPIRSLKDVRTIKKLLADKPRDFCLFVVGISTNLRGSDLLQLTVGHARNIEVGGEIEIVEKKTKKHRRLTFNEEAAEAMRKLAEHMGDRYDDNEPLFQGKRGPLTRQTITLLVKQWCRMINLNINAGAHTLRKTWGVHQYERVGTPLPIIQACFQHASQKMTLEYLCIQEKDKEAAYLNLKY